MDHLGYRLKFGVLAPSTNTIVQPDYDDFRPVGITNHHSRIEIPNMPVASDEDFIRLVGKIQDNTLHAIDQLKCCEIDYLVMGMSATTFWGGRKEAEKYINVLMDRAGVGVSFGSFATEAALNAYGVKKIAFLSPYFPIANEQVRRFFEDCGFSVVKDICLQRPSPVQIAYTSDEIARQTLHQLENDDVDAIVQVGTNMSMVRMAAAAELYLGKPVIAINTATYWHALRVCGIQDKIYGFGKLLSVY